MPAHHCQRLVLGAVPTRLSPQRQAVPEFETTAQGSRVATSIGGLLTRRGVDIIVIDDPLNPEKALSQIRRLATNEWYDHTLYSRLNDKLAGAIVLIMHGLHENLPSGVTRGTTSPATCWFRSRGSSSRKRRQGGMQKIVHHRIFISGLPDTRYVAPTAAGPHSTRQ